jgi:ubiquinone/menaquinone biosynthesis C-methylase UbiE
MNDSVEFFNNAALEGRFDSYNEEKREKILSLFDDVQFPLNEPLIILDCACGTGRTTEIIASRLGPGSEIYGVDSSPAMIERARSLRKAPPDVKFDFQVADALALPFDTDKFDWVLVVDSFPHFRDYPAALLELKRVTKDGGFIAILEQASTTETNQHHREIGGAVANDMLPSALEFMSMLKESGLWMQIYIDDDDGFRVLARK